MDCLEIDQVQKMGSFLITCLKSLSVHTWLSKYKGSLKGQKEQFKIKLFLFMSQEWPSSTYLWVSICSTSTLNVLVTKLSIYPCPAAHKTPDFPQAPALLEFRREEDNGCRPAGKGPWAPSPDLASTSASRGGSACKLHAAWRETPRLTLCQRKGCVFILWGLFPRATSYLWRMNSKGRELPVCLLNVHPKSGFLFCFAVVQNIRL